METCYAETQSTQETKLAGVNKAFCDKERKKPSHAGKTVTQSNNKEDLWRMSNERIYDRARDRHKLQEENSDNKEQKEYT